MREKIKAKISMLVIIILISCQSQENHEYRDVNNILIDNTLVKNTYDISELIDDLSIIPLSETKDNFVGEIYKVYKTQEKYIIWDRFQTKKIQLFDQNGIFLKTILKTGAGPDETLQISDCFINYKGELEAYDFTVKKMYLYDSLFNFKGSIKSKLLLRFKNIYRIPSSDNYIGYAAFNEYNPAQNGKLYHLAFLDKNLNIIKTSLDFDKKFQGIDWLSYTYHFFTYRDTLRFLQAYDNYIYNIIDSNVEKRYRIVYAKNDLPDNILETVVGKNLNIFKDRNVRPNDKDKYFKNYAIFMGRWLENDKYSYILSRQGLQYTFITLFNKESNRVLFSAKYLVDNLRYKLDFPTFMTYDAETNSFISIIDGALLKRCLHNESKFNKELIISPEKNYIINVKLK